MIDGNALLNTAWDALKGYVPDRITKARVALRQAEMEWESLVESRCRLYERWSIKRIDIVRYVQWTRLRAHWNLTDARRRLANLLAMHLTLLNRIPRPEGWGPWSYSQHPIQPVLRCELSGGGLVCWQPHRRQLVYHRGWGTSDAPSDFRDCLTYLLTGWLPIATAPVDGTTVDLLVDDERVADALYDLDYGWSTEFVESCYHPTHWRPLPPSPEEI
jgi:hypothetical protein